ncbi:MAG: AraC family transcriptional regulator, partial [Cyanobacteria bacterium J06648_10]
HRAKWNAENQYLLLSIDPDVWADAVEPDRHSIELIPHFATADPLIHGIGLALKSEIELSGSENSLYADTLRLTLFTPGLFHSKERFE